MTEVAPSLDTAATPPVTADSVRASEEVQCYLRAADQQAELKGYTEHGVRHCSLVSMVAHSVLVQLGASPRRAELAAIAGLLHDTGNLMGRAHHAGFGASLAHGLLQRMGMPPDEVVVVVAAIANHDEDGGVPVNDVSAALILADKADVHHSRVRSLDFSAHDIHDRVNRAAHHSFVKVNQAQRRIAYELSIDTESLAGGVFDYFEIFLPRMLMARQAAKFLGCTFELHINNMRMV